MATAIYSSLLGRAVDNTMAMTGEVSVHGQIKPVGGVMSKVDAARKAGIKKVFIPGENWLDIFAGYQDIDIVPVREVGEVLENALVD
jgi:Lon-like ATP-dependent protease